MPPLADVSNAVSVVLKGTNQGQVWMNKIFYEHPPGAPTVANLDELGDIIAGAWNTEIAPLCNTGVSLTDLILTDISSRTGASLTMAVGPFAGTRAGSQLPVSVACCLSWLISNRYRGGHPRIYLPAGVQADILNGRLWTTTFLTAARSAAADFFASIGSPTIGVLVYQQVAVSYFTGSHKTPEDPHPDPVPRVPPAKFPITATRVGSRVDTQRRRLGKEPV